MNRRKTSLRRAFWVFAAALMLKAAMPLLASASAHAQGKTLVEVCTVYGVSLVPVDEQGHEPAPDHGAVHGGHHCALTALGAPASPSADVLAMVLYVSFEAPAPRSSRAADACAAWVARLKHGPPAFA